MKPIPQLNLDRRTETFHGADFICFRFKVNAPALKPGIADRMEMWKQVGRRKLKEKLTVENYVIETDGSGKSQMLPFWEDNWRLAKIGNTVYELLSSESVEHWR